MKPTLLRHRCGLILLTAGLFAVFAQAGTSAAAPIGERPIGLCHAQGHWRSSCAVGRIGRHMTMRRIPIPGVAVVGGIATQRTSAPGAWPRCMKATAWKRAHNVAGVTLAKAWNVVQWCYNRSGIIVRLKGDYHPPKVYDLGPWNVTGRHWRDRWRGGYVGRQMVTNTSASFAFEVGPVDLQKWSTNVCVVVGGHGRSRFCK